MRPRALACAVGLAALACACSDDSAGETDSTEGDGGGPPQTLREAAERRGFFVGTAFVEGRDDPRFETVASREFNTLTVPLYPSETHPAPGTYDFTVADRAVALAERAGMRMRGHPLIWGRLTLPEYVSSETDPGALEDWLRDHVRTIVSRYRGTIAQYDVVNEPLTLVGTPGANGDGIESYVFTRLLGRDYIRIALEEAHAADPDATLFVNDFFVEEPGPKADALHALARDLVDEGAPLHAVGFQAHVRPPFSKQFEPTRDAIAAEIARYEALGLGVELTELDVTRWPEVGEERQAEIYGDTVSACVESPGCTAVTVWGVSDAHTWIDQVLGKPDGAPLLFDEEYEPKPAYDAVMKALGGE